MDNQILEEIIYHINKVLDCVGLLECKKINRKEIAEKLLIDLYEFSRKDPSSEYNYHIILESYMGYKAILYYRVANYIVNYLKDVFFQIKARKISEIAKRETGIEIHPKATIGVPFILDHGFGTVIGETTIIGDYCYILQGVILGSKSIANNQKNKRHPTIGNYVEIGAFSRILGDIEIGNYVFISPHSIVTHSIPDNSRVIIKPNIKVVNE